MIKKFKSSNKPNYKKLFLCSPLLVSKDFSLWMGDNKLDIARFGVIVAKKHVKLAVVRNYAKRFSKELFINYKNYYHGKDVVLVIKNWNLSELEFLKKKLAGVYFWLYYFGLKL